MNRRRRFALFLEQHHLRFLAQRLPAAWQPPLAVQWLEDALIPRLFDIRRSALARPLRVGDILRVETLDEETVTVILLCNEVRGVGRD